MTRSARGRSSACRWKRPWNAPWLSETLASCVELMAYRQREGDAAYEKRFYDEIEIATRLTRPHGVVIGASTEHFGGDGEMTQVLRDAGAANLMGIEQAVGQEAFIRALQTYIAENAGGIAALRRWKARLSGKREATGAVIWRTCSPPDGRAERAAPAAPRTARPESDSRFAQCSPNPMSASAAHNSAEIVSRA